MYVHHVFSQTKDVEYRRIHKLHPVNEMHRFLVLTVCFFCAVCVALTYAFDLFTTQFRAQFELSIGDLSTISTVGIVFCYFLVPYSAIYETCGPFICFWICAVTGTIGCLCLALTFNGKIKGNTATIAVFYAFLNTAAGLTDSTYIPVLFEYFPRNRGPVVCLSKVMTGMGSSLIACIASTFFKSNITGFIYFLMAMIIVVMALASCVVTLPPYILNWWRRRGKTPEQLALLTSTRPYFEHKNVPMPRLVIGYTIVLLMVVFYAIEAPVVAYTNGVSRGAEIGIGVVAVALCLALCLVLLPLPALGGMNEPAPEETEYASSVNGDAEEGIRTNTTGDEKAAAVGAVAEPFTEVEEGALVEDDLNHNHNNNNNNNGDAASKKLESPSDSTSSDGSGSNVRVVGLISRQDPRYDAPNALRYFLSLDLWLVFGFSICICPICILVSYNASTISIAKSGTARDVRVSALYTAFLGIGNSAGRVLFGLWEAYVQHQDPANRRFLITFVLPFAPLLVIIGGVILIVIPGSAVLFPFLIVYTLNGIYAAMGALLYTSLFERYHNMLYSCGFVITALTAVFFNRLLFGMYVDAKHKKFHLLPEQECNRPDCIRVPFIVVTCLGVPGTLMALLLHIRYRRFVTRTRERENALRASNQQQLRGEGAEEASNAAELQLSE